MLLACAETVGKGCPMANNSNTQHAETELAVRLSWETVAQVKTKYISPFLTIKKILIKQVHNVSTSTLRTARSMFFL